MKFKMKNRNGETLELGFSDMRASMEQYGDKANAKNSSTAFKRFLAENNLTKKEFMRAVGIENIGKMQVRQLLDNDGLAPLFNAAVEDGLRIGFQKQGRWEQLVARTIEQDELSAQWYYLDEGDLEDETELRLIGQGAPIPVGTIKVGDNQFIRMHKRGRGIEWTDEAKRAPISLVQMWLERLGRKLGRDYEAVAIDRLLNGYFADGSDAAPTMGVRTAGTLTLVDMFYAQAYMEDEYGVTPNLAIMSLNTATAWAETRDNGGLVFADYLRRGEIPNIINAAPFVSNRVPDNRIILVDTEAALVRYEAKEFGVETDRNVKTQVEGSYGTEISEFVPFDENARLIITLDQSR